MSSGSDHHALLARVEELCRSFEAALVDGRDPQINLYLTKAPRHLQQALFDQLLALFLEHRRAVEDLPGSDATDETCELAGTADAIGLQAVEPTVDSPPTGPRDGSTVGPAHHEATLEYSGSDAKQVGNREGGNREGGDAEEPTGAPNTGSLFAGYEILNVIAQGGMGVVYQARQIALNRTVALKMILAGQLASPQDVQRFRNEAEAAGKLQHPNIVAIHEVGEHRERHFFSMDFVAGQSLAQIAADHPLDGRQAASYVAAISDAIAYAHHQGVLHRDLKPGNVLVDEQNQVRVTDFGLAKQISDDSELTRTGQILGTPSYMPPEQARGDQARIGPLSDIYSLGALLYKLITGSPPFRGASPFDTIAMVMDQEPVRPRSLNPGAPRDLETICLKCLQKEPDKRYASAELLADDLRRFLNNEPILARPASATERLGKWVRRKPAVAGLVATALLAAVGAATGAGFYVAQGRQYTEKLEGANNELNATNQQLTKTNGLLTSQTELARARQREAEQARVGESAARAKERAIRLRLEIDLARREYDDAVALCAKGEIDTGLFKLAHAYQRIPTAEETAPQAPASENSSNENPSNENSSEETSGEETSGEETSGELSAEDRQLEFDAAALRQLMELSLATWQQRSHRLTAFFECPFRVDHCLASPDGTRLFLGGPINVLWRFANGKLQRVAALPSEPDRKRLSAVCFSADDCVWPRPMARRCGSGTPFPASRLAIPWH